MTIKNDGVQAFPSNHLQGMTLRDFFAAKVMQSLCGYTNYDERIEEWDFEHLAKNSYKAADAMIKARKP